MVPFRPQAVLIEYPKATAATRAIDGSLRLTQGLFLYRHAKSARCGLLDNDDYDVRLGDAIGRVRDKLTTPAGVCLNVVGGVRHASRQAGSRAAQRLFCDHKTCGLEPAQFVGRGRFGIDRRGKIGVAQCRSASNMAAKNTLQRKMPSLPGKRH